MDCCPSRRAEPGRRVRDFRGQLGRLVAVQSADEWPAHRHGARRPQLHKPRPLDFIRRTRTISVPVSVSPGTFPGLEQGKTVVRGGFSITYQGGGNFAALDGTASGDVPGAALQAGVSGAIEHLSSFGGLRNRSGKPDHAVDVQLPGLSLPGGRAAAGRPGQSGAGGKTPGASTAPIPSAGRYSVRVLRRQLRGALYPELYPGNQRSIGRKMTVDVRYVGTVARKLFSEQPVNSANFLTNGLKEAFDAARAGGESTLLNDLTSSVNGAYGGSGATWLRQQTGGCPGSHADHHGRQPRQG